MNICQIYSLEQYYSYSKLDLQVAYNSILYMAEKASSLYPSLPTDSSTSEDEPIPDLLKTSVDEKMYRTNPGPAIATSVALMHSKPQVNPIVPRGKRKKSRKVKKTTMALVPKTMPTQTVQSSICSIL